ncbi:MAG: hypothetical protein JW729_07880 [Bacteroidales bacterium]|nr:hypothetical protein [Bacteroidales bacterium]
MRKIATTFFFLLIFSQLGLAQGTWWNNINEWDRIIPWERYLTQSPGFMGPNAFPVPEIKEGKMDSLLTFETAFEVHLNQHEQTKNIFSSLFIPFSNKKVGLNLFIVPIEIYKYDTFLRDQRSSTDYDGQGTATGDLYIGTHIQLIENKKWIPDILLTINIKTASGNSYGAARFSDSPGYYFDLSFGKSLALNKEKSAAIRMYGMLGFYAWQTNLPDHFQDDAVLYGIGAHFFTKKFNINQSFGGFKGYLNNGDHAQVYRLDIQTNTKRTVNYKLRFQYGLKDIDYRSFRFSLLYHL